MHSLYWLCVIGLAPAPFHIYLSDAFTMGTWHNCPVMDAMGSPWRARPVSVGYALALPNEITVVEEKDLLQYRIRPQHTNTTPSGHICPDFVVQTYCQGWKPVLNFGGISPLNPVVSAWCAIYGLRDLIADSSYFKKSFRTTIALI